MRFQISRSLITITAVLAVLSIYALVVRIHSMPQRAIKPPAVTGTAITFTQSSTTNNTTNIDIFVPGPVYLEGQLTGSMSFYVEDSLHVQTVPIVIELKVLRGRYWKNEPKPAHPNQ